MKKISFISLTILVLANISEAQIEVNDEGNSGFGISDAVSKIEIQDQKYLMFNAHSNQSGILFHEVYGKYANSVDYGAYIEYDENSDELSFGTYQVGNKLKGLSFYRANAHVGIGSKNTSWTYELRVDDDLQVLNRLMVGGDAWIHGNEVVTSDINVKTNISTLESSDVLKKLLQLNARSYEYKSKENLETFFQSTISNPLSSEISEKDSIMNQAQVDIPNFPSDTQYGLIAQEVKELFPNAVKFNEELQLLGIDYNALIPLLIEATKEQQKTIEELRQELDFIKKQVEIRTL